ncbi:MAG: hypothetical protein ACFE8M_10285 [Candidatus Hermodarchaeota archaeon]
MLRSFIFNEIKNNWVEEDEYLFYHDLCAFLDEDNQIVYLWRGPKSTKARYKKGYHSLSELISKEKQLKIQINVLAEYIPDSIKERLEKMLIAAQKQKEISKYKFSKFATIRLYSVFLIISIIFPIFSLLLLINYVFWPISYGNYVVSSQLYQNWLFFPKILLLISLIMFILNIIIGLYEMEAQVIIFSLMGLLICSGILLYLQQGIYLFLFQEGSTSTSYIIKIQDITLFYIVIFTAITIFELPSLLKLISFIRTYRKYIF